MFTAEKYSGNLYSLNDSLDAKYEKHDFSTMALRRGANSNSIHYSISL